MMRTALLSARPFVRQGKGWSVYLVYVLMTYIFQVVGSGGNRPCPSAVLTPNGSYFTQLCSQNSSLGQCRKDTFFALNGL